MPSAGTVEPLPLTAIVSVYITGVGVAVGSTVGVGVGSTGVGVAVGSTVGVGVGSTGVGVGVTSGAGVGVGVTSGAGVGVGVTSGAGVGVGGGQVGVQLTTALMLDCILKLTVLCVYVLLNPRV